jgi:hypothetical protein
MPVAAVEPIVDEDSVLRRIHPSQVVEDKNAGTKRPSSGAFTDLELSADSEFLLAKYGLDFTHSLKDHEGQASVSCSRVRRLTQTISHIQKIALKNLHCQLRGARPPAVARSKRKRRG